MTRLLPLSILLIMTTLLHAQDSTDAQSPWTKKGLAALNFTQVYLENWQGGGQNSISGTVLFNYSINYKKDKWTWDNTFDGAYGLAKVGESGELRKTDDRIEINSKVGRETPVINTFYAALATFRTQWDVGRNYEKPSLLPISDPFSPAYLLLGIGIDYKPSEAFSAYISPVTSKTTIVDNQRLADNGAFGVEKGETIRYEVGGFLKMQYIKDIFENVKLTTRIDLFSNYLNNPQNIDVNWETLIGFKVNKYLSASISTNLVYDDDIDFSVDRNGDGIEDGTQPAVQFKEVFSLGLQYQF